MDDPMKLECFALSEPDRPRELDVRPAPAERAWIDATSQRFAARCLPLLIANSHGWEVLFKDRCEVNWTGGSRIADLDISTESGSDTYVASHFGEGIVTFRIPALFRTEPGYNLWVGGPVNRFKDGVQALTGIVETDWSPFTFTMNWKVTRSFHPIVFERDEPICHIFPLPRGLVDEVQPVITTFDSDAELKRDYEQARESRLNFIEKLKQGDPEAVAKGWQKEYFRGEFASGRQPVAGHQTKLSPKPFAVKAGHSKS
jgi:hypothetical protein